ncbi:MAG: LysE family translocator [Rhizobiales bacterium]|nr:LysE family translocator [Hyphomicrobiales bacterium]
MTSEHIAALAAFCFVTAISPGPNNIMLMASGVNYGVRRTLPHVAGIVVGWPLMVLLVGLGLGQVFELFPGAYTALKLISGAYMLWLAWKIATAVPKQGDGAGEGKPMGFIGAALFQWVNGKAWIMAVSSIAAFTLTSDYMLSVAAIVAVFFVMSIVSSTSWTVFGAGLRQVLTDPRYFRAINIVLALSLLASLWPMLRH